jgi:hypothetical protein
LQRIKAENRFVPGVMTNLALLLAGNIVAHVLENCRGGIFNAVLVHQNRLRLRAIPGICRKFPGLDVRTRPDLFDKPRFYPPSNLTELFPKFCSDRKPPMIVVRVVNLVTRRKMHPANFFCAIRPKRILRGKNPHCRDNDLRPDIFV